MKRKEVKKENSSEPLFVHTEKKSNEEKNQNEKQPEHKNKKAVFGLLAFIAILIIGIWVNEIIAKPQGLEKIAARVNGQDITVKQLQEIYWTLPPSVQQDPLVGEIVLNQSIYETILLQEAAKQGLTVTAQEIEQSFTEVRNKNNATVEELQKELEKAGLDFTFVKKFYQKQILITKLLQKESKKIEISEQEISNLLKDLQQDEKDVLLREQAKAFLLQQKLQEYAQALLAKADVKKQ